MIPLLFAAIGGAVPLSAPALMSLPTVGARHVTRAWVSIAGSGDAVAPAQALPVTRLAPPRDRERHHPPAPEIDRTPRAGREIEPGHFSFRVDGARNQANPTSSRPDH